MIVSLKIRIAEKMKKKRNETNRDETFKLHLGDYDSVVSKSYKPRCYLLQTWNCLQFTLFFILFIYISLTDPYYKVNLFLIHEGKIDVSLKFETDYWFVKIEILNTHF